MDAFISGWQGHTFVARIDPSVINPMAPGFATRVTVVGDFTLNSLFIGPISARGPWQCDVMYQLTWNGGNKVLTTDGSLTPLFCDAFPIGIDGTRGFLISGYFDPGGNGLVGVKYIEPGWAARSVYGDHAADLDKSSLNVYTDQTAFANVIVVQDVDGYYTPPSTGIGILP